MTRPTLRTCSSGRYWQGVYTDHNGKRQYINGIGATAEVTREQAEFILDNRKLDTPTEFPTVREWCDRYAAMRTELAFGSIVLIEDTAARLIRLMGDAQIARVTPTMAHEFKLTLGDVGATTAYAHLARARAIFGAAVRYRVAHANPFDAVRLAKPPKIDQFRYVTLEEFEKVIFMCQSRAYVNLFSLCRLAGTRSGQRGGEALNLTWKDVDFERKLLTVTDQKRHCTRVVPMSPRLAEILHADPQDDERVCPINPFSVDKKARQIIADGGLEPFAKPLHSLRKSLSTDWLSIHPPPLVVKWLGHSHKVALESYHRADRPDDLARVSQAH